MDGMLSQDEINALLNGMDSDSSNGSTDDSNSNTDTSSYVVDYGSNTQNSNPDVDDDLLTPFEKDAIGEVANISMGSSATTLYSLVNRKVNITTPIVTLARWNSLLDAYERPCVFIQIKYTQGMDGSNILVLKENDVKIITDLMMGGDGTNTDDDLTELHLSAISEAMNQMMGASATSLSTMLGTTIDISPPEATLMNMMEIKDGEKVAPFLGGTFVKIEFTMQIGDLVDSTIMQLYPLDFSKTIVETFMGSTETTEPVSQPQQMNTNTSMPNTNPMMNAQFSNQSGAGMQMQGQFNANVGMQQGMGMQGMNMQPGMMNMQQGMNMQSGMNAMGMDYSQGMNMQGMQGANMGYSGVGMSGMGMPGMGMPGMGMPSTGYPNMGYPGMNMQNINVAPAQFQTFSNDIAVMQSQENIGLIKDVPLEVTVELGRTSKPISDILDFAPGTIIELNRIAGEPIDVLVNGKFVAKGEVVVIEESFGIRVTEIIK